MDSTFQPDDTRRQQLEGFIGSVCVCTNIGRLGIVTHVAVSVGEWMCCGFGLDGKGVWTSTNPFEIDRNEAFYNKLNDCFNGRLSAHDALSKREVDNIVQAIVTKINGEQFFSADEAPSFRDFSETATQIDRAILGKIHSELIKSKT